MIPVKRKAKIIHLQEIWDSAIANNRVLNDSATLVTFFNIEREETLAQTLEGHADKREAILTDSHTDSKQFIFSKAMCPLPPHCKIYSLLLTFFVGILVAWVWVYGILNTTMCVCIYVCVFETERERERGNSKNADMHYALYITQFQWLLRHLHDPLAWFWAFWHGSSVVLEYLRYVLWWF